MAETRKVRLTRRWNLGGEFYGPAKGEKSVEVELPVHLADMVDMVEQPAREAEAAAREAARTAKKAEG